MVRTKADRVPNKAVGGKAPSSKSASSTPSKKAGGKGRNYYAGGNRSCPRETPEWQKPITGFLDQKVLTENTANIHSPVSEMTTPADSTNAAEGNVNGS